MTNRLLQATGIAVLSALVGAIVSLHNALDQMFGIVLVSALIGFGLGAAFKFRLAGAGQFLT